jgi:hypothetical protein
MKADNSKHTDVVISVDETDLQRGGCVYLLRVWCMVCRHQKTIADGATLAQLAAAGAHQCPDQGLPL